MALTCRFAASSSCRGPQARLLARGFSTSIRQAEGMVDASFPNYPLIDVDEKPKTISTKAQARLDSAEAFQILARRSTGAAATDGQSKPFSQAIYSNTSASPSSNHKRITLQPYSEEMPAFVSERTTRTPNKLPSGQNRFPTEQKRAARTPPGGPRRPRRQQDDHNDRGGFRPSSDATDGQAEDEMTPEEHKEYLKSLGHTEGFMIQPAQGPHLDMAAMMMEFAPKHFGVTENASGAYADLTDTSRKGLLQDIVRQVRKNETYLEKDIDQLAKKLGPLMPRA